MITVYTFPFFFFFNDTATTEIYTLSLHDALPISTTGTPSKTSSVSMGSRVVPGVGLTSRSEEHTSELQSSRDLVCRLLLEKKQCTLFLVGVSYMKSVMVSHFNIQLGR